MRRKNAKGLTEKQMRRLRERAKHRKRRIIMDNDGDDAVYHTREATPEAFLRTRMTGLVETQVDTVIYAPWNLGGVWSVHRTNVGQVFTCTAKGFGNNVTGELIRQGTDPLELVVNFCRTSGLEVFYSKRMNDMHDSSVRAWYHRYVKSRFKWDHPEYLMADPTDRRKWYGWAALNYGRREVRDFVFRFVKDVCDHYDIDGVQLDFLRNPILFKPPTRSGDPAGQKELDLMTGLVRRIRRMTEQVAMRRGRPMLLAVRVPDSVEFCRHVGIDIERWLSEGLVDLLTTTCIFRLSPWKVSVDLGHEYGVPVYPCLSDTRHPGEHGRIRASGASYRARATNVWSSEADGVYLFNYYTHHGSHSPLLRECGAPQTLVNLEKVYTTHARSVQTTYCVPGGERFLNVSPLTVECPRKLEADKTEEVELHIGEKLSAKTSVTLRLHAQRLGRAVDLSVTLNGKALREGVKSGQWVEYRVSPVVVKRGENRLRLTLRRGSRSRPILDDLVMWVRPRMGD